MNTGNYTGSSSWSTLDEINFIDYMCSNDDRLASKRISQHEMKVRLRNYISTLHKSTVYTFNLRRCESYAQGKLASL